MKRAVLFAALFCMLSRPASAQLQISQFPAASLPLNCEYTLVEQGGITSSAKVCDFGIPVQGSTAPATDLFTGRQWLDTSTTPPTLRIYDGTQWVGQATLNLSTHVWTPIFSSASPGVAASLATPVPEFKLHSIPSVQSTGTGTSEQFLDSWNLPGGSLDITGRNVRITAWFAHAGNTHTVTDKLYFGSESVSDGGVSTASTVTRLSIVVTKVGTNQQSVVLEGAAGVSLVAGSAYIAATENDAASITIQASCTDGTSSAGDGNLVGLTVELL